MLLPNALAVGSYEAKRANIIEKAARIPYDENAQHPREVDEDVFDTKATV